jgi:hypothetical protein
MVETWLVCCRRRLASEFEARRRADPCRSGPLGRHASLAVAVGLKRMLDCPESSANYRRSTAGLGASRAVWSGLACSLPERAFTLVGRGTFRMQKAQHKEHE